MWSSGLLLLQLLFCSRLTAAQTYLQWEAFQCLEGKQPSEISRQKEKEGLHCGAHCMHSENIWLKDTLAWNRPSSWYKKKNNNLCKNGNCNIFKFACGFTLLTTCSNNPSLAESLVFPHMSLVMCCGFTLESRVCLSGSNMTGSDSGKEKGATLHQLTLRVSAASLTCLQTHGCYTWRNLLSWWWLCNK